MRGMLLVLLAASLCGADRPSLTICGVRLGMSTVEVLRLRGQPTKQGPQRPGVYAGVPIEPAVGWWLMYVAPGQNRRQGPSPLDVGLDRKDGRVVAIAGPQLERAGKALGQADLGPSLGIWTSDHCYHQYAEAGVRACGAEETQVYVHPTYFLQHRRPRIPRLEGMPLGRPVQKLIPGVQCRRLVEYYGEGHPSRDPEAYSVTTLEGRVVFIEGPRWKRGGKVLVDRGWSRQQVEASLGRPARVVRHRGQPVLLYPRYLARVVMWDGKVWGLEMGMEPYLCDPPEVNGDFSPAEVRALLPLAKGALGVPRWTR